MTSILSFDEFSTWENLYIDEAKKKNQAELSTMENLNRLYAVPIERINASESIGEDVEIRLYMLCHVNFYIGFSSLLRQHFATTFNLLRVALDASFAAYILLEGVGTSEQYRSGDSLFRYAKNTIKQRMKDQMGFVKATKLLDLHEKCSQAVSHADYTTLDTRMFFYKLFLAGSPTSIGESLYFGIRENPERFTASCWVFLLSHSLILNIFGAYLTANNLWTPEEFARLQHMIEDLTKKLRELNVEEVKKDPSIKMFIDALLLD